jgi:hypothetical protein
MDDNNVDAVIVSAATAAITAAKFLVRLDMDVLLPGRRPRYLGRAPGAARGGDRQEKPHLLASSGRARTCPGRIKSGLLPMTERFKW